METTKCRINCALLSPSLCSMEILICRFLAISADYSSLFNRIALLTAAIFSPAILPLVSARIKIGSVLSFITVKLFNPISISPSVKCHIHFQGNHFKSNIVSSCFSNVPSFAYCKVSQRRISFFSIWISSLNPRIYRRQIR